MTCTSHCPSLLLLGCLLSCTPPPAIGEQEAVALVERLFADEMPELARLRHEVSVLEVGADRLITLRHVRHGLRLPSFSCRVGRDGPGARRVTQPFGWRYPHGRMPRDCVKTRPPGAPAQTLRCPDLFTLTLPAEFRQRVAFPIDSAVACYESPRLRLGLDYGAYSDDLSRAGRASTVIIDGRRARLGWYRLAAAENDGFTRAVALHLEPVVPGGDSLTLAVRARDDRGLAAAEQLLRALRLEEGPLRAAR